MFKVILPMVANVPHNYIIDQTNVYKTARKCKLRPFSDYQKIAVVVFPKPEELKRRYEKGSKEMGKEVPTNELSKMIELNRDESQKYLDQMKQDIPSLPNNSPSTALPNQGSLKANTGQALHRAIWVFMEDLMLNTKISSLASIHLQQPHAVTLL
ncbi:putative P-loop containing nucleoside triphosphate hydrolase [Medicago truncatula]|uniref:Putative P-loop containing nucleoside triphosphate hydrolase n=1 Tax=Medicago truncatula TaxID=3880 RepID=A0A396J9J5_MEDTR|nr:putative P-loop containing nucleoside triphosphate hydrolase [Medicago truncatula]